MKSPSRLGSGTGATADAPPMRRLDLLPNPYAPSQRVAEALGAIDQLPVSTPIYASWLQDRIARQLGVPSSWIVPAAGTAELTTAILLWRRLAGPLVTFPPTGPEPAAIATLVGMPQESIPRNDRLLAATTTPSFAPATRAATFWIDTPSDPAGTLLSPAEAFRLCRAGALVVADERHGAYAFRSLLPLVGEVDNLVVTRTFETWAGLTAAPYAFAVARPEHADAIRAHLIQREIPAASLVAASASLDDLAWLDATVDRVRTEKARLYRMLRKMNMVEPAPSWANFMMARVVRGDRDQLVARLREHGIVVAVPAGMDGAIRISAVSPEATTALKAALVDSVN